MLEHDKSRRQRHKGCQHHKIHRLIPQHVQGRPPLAAVVAPALHGRGQLVRPADLWVLTGFAALTAGVIALGRLGI